MLQEVMLNRLYYGFAVANLPLVITELVAVVIGWDNVNKQDVLGFGVHAGHLDLIAWKHPPVEVCGDSLLEMLLFDFYVKERQLLTCQVSMRLKELA